MKKFFKWFLIVLLAFVGLLVAVIIALPFLIDPNDFKDEIRDTIQKHTGRTLTIEGDIRLSVFPWLGLHLGRAQLSNAADFGQQPMLKLNNIQLGVKLLPLLRQELETDETLIEGLEVTLQRQTSGKTNWEDLFKSVQAAPTQSTPTKPQPQSAMPLAALAIGGLKLKNANIVWDDQQNKQRWLISNLDLTTGAITWDKNIPIKLTFSAQAEHLNARSENKLATDVIIHQDQRIQFQNFKLAQQLWHPQLPNSPALWQASLTKMAIDLANQTLKVDALQLQNDNLIVQTSASVSKFLDAPQYEAALDIPVFNPRLLAKAHHIALPKDIPANALTKLHGQLSLKGNAHSLSITRLDLQLDDSHLTGAIALPSFNPIKYRYNLALNNLDVDAYQTPSNEKKPVPSPAAGAAAATQLPLDLLRHLDIKGQLNIDHLKVSSLTVTKIETQLTAANGLMRLQPLQAQLYDGTYSGDLQLNANNSQPVLSVNEHLKGVALGPLLKDLIGDDKLHGSTNLQAKLMTRGSDLAEMRKQLNGTLSADMKDGYLKGIDIDYAERKLRAQLKREPIPAKPAKPQTGFSKLDMNFKVENGIAHTQSLDALLPHARMHGTGDIDLVREQLNMTLNFKFSSKVQGQAGKGYDELDRIALPVHLRGPLTQPEYDIDFDGALKTLYKQKLDKEKAEAKEKYEQKIKDEKQKLKEKLDQKANDLLKKLFNR